MKLKDKLAKEYATWIEYPLNTTGVEIENIYSSPREYIYFSLDKMQGFIAGFDSAYEVIKEKILKELQSEQALKTIGFPFNIGEEEVE